MKSTSFKSLRSSGDVKNLMYQINHKKKQVNLTSNKT